MKDEFKKGKVASTLLAEHLNRMNVANCSYEIEVQNTKYYIVASIEKPILPTKELAGIVAIAEMALHNAKQTGYIEGLRKHLK